jgi:hypothetical protein
LIEPVAEATDPPQCLGRTDCSTTRSRTLQFVFDYAAAGAPLVQRDASVVYSALCLRLAEAEQSRFEVHAQCRMPSCRIEGEQVLQI